MVNTPKNTPKNMHSNRQWNKWQMCGLAEKLVVAIMWVAIKAILIGSK